MLSARSAMLRSLCSIPGFWALILFASCPAVAGTSTVVLSAAPNLIEADGRSISTIAAEVHDSSGGLVRQPTNVRFTSSLGSIDAVVPTTGGVARATLRSSMLPGTAVVTALVESQPAVARIEVEFVAAGLAVSREAFYTVSAEKYLAYSVEQRTVDAVGGVRISCRGLLITADEAQVDVSTNTVRAFQRGVQNDIRLIRRDKTVSCSALNFDLSLMRGVAVVAGESSPEQAQVSGWDLRNSKLETERPESDFQVTPLEGKGTLIKARSIAVRMGEEVQFKRARLYMDGEELMSLPLHTVSLDGSDTGVNRFVSVGTGGLAMDVPLYYQLEPESSGALRIRHNQPGGWGWYSTQPGWSLDLEQHYITRGGSSGKFGMSRLTQRDWGAHWMQDSQFSPEMRGYFFVDSSNHSDVYASASLTRSFASSAIGLNLSGTKYRGSDASAQADLYWRTDARELRGSGLRYALATRSIASQKSFGQGVELQLYSNPWKIGDRGSLTGSLAVGHNWGGGRSGGTLLGDLVLSHRFSKTAGGTLRYAYADQPGSSDSAHHRLIGNLFAGSGRRWRSSLYFTYGLDYRSTISFADFSYGITPRWRLGVSGTYSNFTNTRYTDLEVAIGRSLGETLANQDLALVWSKSRNKFRLEVRAARL